jgi:Ca2+-transporting ATPase
MGAAEVVAGLAVDPARGLAPEEAARRLAEHGPNQLRRLRRRRGWRVLLDQFRSVLVLLLAGAVAVALAFGELVEATAIAIVIAINAAIGFGVELRALTSMEALRQLGRVRARVRRGCRSEEVDAAALVPGDIVLVEGGDVITADLRILEASRLQANESTLTGESVPVPKSAAPAAAAARIGERGSMLWKGTSVTRGSGEAVVVATGMDTELGQISRLVEQAESELTPLERRLNKLGQGLLVVTLAIVAVIAGLGALSGGDVYLIVETAIALAVATVPEGLPAIATIALARGMHRMSRRNALINRLSAVETLGATEVIFTDKTGTLTENRMTVAELAAADGGSREPTASDPRVRDALMVGALCNNAHLGDGGDGVGDPLEVALLAAARAAGIERAALAEQFPELREVAFDADTRMMATVHRDRDGILVAVKGAPEVVIEVAAFEHGERADADPVPLDDGRRARWLAASERLSARGLRVLALARRRLAAEPASVYHELELVALVGLHDPPRADVADAIAACRAAGVRVVMVTGDHLLTARAIAVAVGIAEPDAPAYTGGELRGPDAGDRLLAASVFARVSPAEKLALIGMHQARGATVAMTGDGVNDAPALKLADIGVAMGQRGTAVAREASDMILRDDAFSTIVAAIAEGRVIFDNIRSFVVYLVSCNLAEVLVIGLATAAGAPLPLLPLQILFLNLVTDVFPALALGVGEGAPGVMARPPRPRGEGVLTRAHWARIGAYGALLAVGVLAAFVLALRWLRMPVGAAVSVSFVTLSVGQLVHVFNMRADDSPAVVNEVSRNPYVWGALALCAALVLVAVHWSALADVLALAPPGARGWGLALGLGALPLVTTLPPVRRLLPGQTVHCHLDREPTGAHPVG